MTKLFISDLHLHQTRPEVTGLFQDFIDELLTITTPNPELYILGDLFEFWIGDDYEDPLYSVVAFTDMTAQIPTKVVYDPLEDNSFPQGMTIAANRAPSFTDDLSSLVFGIVEAEMTELSLIHI